MRRDSSIPLQEDVLPAGAGPLGPGPLGSHRLVHGLTASRAPCRTARSQPEQVVRGVGPLNKVWLTKKLAEGCRWAQRTVKEALDPRGVLHPGNKLAET